MASGTNVGVDDGPKENKRFLESCVYRRKSYKGNKNKPNSLTAVVPNAVPTTTSIHSDAVDNDGEVVKNDNVVDVEKNENDELARERAQTVLPEDGDLRVEVVSDDSSPLEQSEPASLNCQQDEPLSSSRLEEATPSTRELPSGNGVVTRGLGNRMKIDVCSRSKEEKLMLKRKLENELDKVRSLIRKVEVKLGQIGQYGGSNPLVSGGIHNGIARRQVQSELGSVVSRVPIRPLHQLNLLVVENSHGASGTVEKEKRTPKANQLYRNSVFLLGKDKFPPAESNKKSKLSGKKHGGVEMGHGFGPGSKFFKSCSSLLDKLMKHKHGWVFNAPVDAEGLGLHDYFTIILNPMDLGTVKTRLNINWYKTPKEFAEDVRLTFSNAMTYNPPGQDVHIMADLLSKIFEDRWIIIESDYNREVRYAFDYGNALPASSPMFGKAAGFRPRPPPLDMGRILDRSESMIQTPKSVRITPSSRTPALKKPKAKDLFKRDMTSDERDKLGKTLMNLPPEKTEIIVQICKKRGSVISHHGDEVELDIESLDTETLWELDRFVINYKKSLSKNKRKAEIAFQRAESAKQAQQMASDMVEVPNENLADERNVSPLLPAPGDKPLDNGNRSSSSSTSSSDSDSSSTDSDTESSSTSGSDAGSQGT